MSEQQFVFHPNPDQEFIFRCYGVDVTIRCGNSNLLLDAERLIRAAFLNRIEIIESSPVSAKHLFEVGLNNGLYYYSMNGSERSCNASKTIVLKFLESMVRITIAEHAVSKVFLHAGVVGWKGKAILIPGNSHSGKTTLVAELIKNGAAYYSDEYAILDSSGYVHAFPRPLAMRGIEENDVQTDVSVESLGGVAGEKPIQVGLVLITEYNQNAKWESAVLNSGSGIIEMIPHTIPIRSNTVFALGVLSKVVESAIVIKSQRHDSEKFAKILLNFLTIA